MKESRAFSLIEVFIYITSFAFLALLAFGYLSRTQGWLLSESLNQDNIIKKNIIQDLIFRDLYSASKDLKDHDITNFIFKKNTLDKNGVPYSISVGYTFGKDGVRRIEGDYNFITRKWTKKIISVVSNTHFDRQGFYGG